ncbi:MAG: hypothetical protein CVV25_08380 [Ignavibacteriae bacterium HGW-Ignavibacteriae-4]|nr:MAG: hypothetical protein CVV25_08380 [Ignavibacteriae bacterium HGW-Ignavibacteriae-4]
MYNIFVSTLLSIIIIASAMASNAQSLEKLTPVSDPFEYQNKYYPVSVGNYWKMLYLTPMGNDKYGTLGHYEYRIIEYTFEEIYFGDSLAYIPVYKKESKYFRPNYSVYESVSYTYLIKTNEGIIEFKKPPRNNKIKPFIFIPSDSSYDYLSLELTGKSIERGIELKTRFWEMNTLRINYRDKDNLGGFYYSIDKGHVYTQFFYKDNNSNYQTNFSDNETFEPSSEFILSELKIE